MSKDTTKGRGRAVKCPTCGTSNYKDSARLVGKRYYCIGSCADDAEYEAEKKKRDKEDWDELFEYIKDVYGHEPTGMMYKQLGEFRKPPYNYTNKGMYLTLKYFYDTKGHKALENSGIGIIPYMYEEAKQNYIKQMEVSEHNIEHKIKEETHYVKVNRRKNKCKEKFLDSIIDFDDLDEELEEDD